MSALNARKKTPPATPASARDTAVEPLAFADTSDIPPPVPHLKPTREQFRRSLEISLAQARAGIGEDFDVVQARLRAKFFPSS